MGRSITLGVVAFALVLVAAGGTANAETLLERGTYLMRSVAACGNCHTLRDDDGAFRDGMELAGGFTIEEEPFTAHVPNITPDRETGIGSWTDDEIITAIREGRRPDGSLIGPPMPFSQYRGLSDRDVRAMVAYLRTAPAVRNETPKSEYRIPLPPSWGPPVGHVPEVARDDPATYGAYLAGPVAHCIECHTPMKDGRFEFANRLGAGGFPIPVGGGIVLSTNITPDLETGIGAWSDADIKRAIMEGIRPDESPIHPIMPFGFFATMSDEDVAAIIAYLRTLPPRRSDDQ